MTKAKRVRLDASRVARVVGDGLIASQDEFAGVGVATLVLDAEHIPTLSEVIRASAFEPDGDVENQWGLSGGHVALMVNLLRPVAYSFVIAFELPGQGILVETALEARLVQLKSGNASSSFKSTFNDQGLIMHVPGREDFPPWPRPYVRAAMEANRRAGMRTVDARRSAEAGYEAMRAVAHLRAGVGSPSLDLSGLKVDDPDSA